VFLGHYIEYLTVHLLEIFIISLLERVELYVKKFT